LNPLLSTKHLHFKFHISKRYRSRHSQTKHHLFSSPSIHYQQKSHTHTHSNDNKTTIKFILFITTSIFKFKKNHTHKYSTHSFFTFFISKFENQNKKKEKRNLRRTTMAEQRNRWSWDVTGFEPWKSSSPQTPSSPAADYDDRKPNTSLVRRYSISSASSVPPQHKNTTAVKLQRLKDKVKVCFSIFNCNCI